MIHTTSAESLSRQRSYEEVLADAVRVLTEAARRTVAWTDGDGREQHDRADFAEFVTLSVAGAAANVGGIEEALAGRAGSWGADYVRQMLQSTVGYDEEHLLEHRTEALTVVVAVDNLLNDLGVWHLYEQAEGELDQRELEELDQLRERLTRQRLQDWTAYGDAFTANVLAATAELLPSLRVPVEVNVYLDWRNDESGYPPCGPLDALWERARDLTPLPGCGIAADCRSKIQIAWHRKPARRTCPQQLWIWTGPYRLRPTEVAPSPQPKGLAGYVLSRYGRSSRQSTQAAPVLSYGPDSRVGANRQTPLSPGLPDCGTGERAQEPHLLAAEHAISADHAVARPVRKGRLERGRCTAGSRRATCAAAVGGVDQPGDRHESWPRARIPAPLPMGLPRDASTRDRPADLVARRDHEKAIRRAQLEYEHLLRSGPECPHGQPGGAIPSPIKGILAGVVCPACGGIEFNDYLLSINHGWDPSDFEQARYGLYGRPAFETCTKLEYGDGHKRDIDPWASPT
jgi:hypothetical protein